MCHGNIQMDTPILLLEDKGLIICKKQVLNASNLKQVYNTFSEDIYAVDNTGRLAVSKKKIYLMKNYQPVDVVPIQDADAYFFDKRGVLYILYTKESKLYYKDLSNVK